MVTAPSSLPESIPATTSLPVAGSWSDTHEQWLAKCGDLGLSELEHRTSPSIIEDTSITPKTLRLVYPKQSIIPMVCFICLEQTDPLNSRLSPLTRWDKDHAALWFHCNRPVCVEMIERSVQQWLAQQAVMLVKHRTLNLTVMRSDKSFECGWDLAYLARHEKTGKVVGQLVHREKELYKAVSIDWLLHHNPSMELEVAQHPFYPADDAQVFVDSIATAKQLNLHTTHRLQST